MAFKSSHRRRRRRRHVNLNNQSRWLFVIVFFCLKDAPSENFLGAQEEHQPGRLGEVIADNLCMRDEFFVLLRDASRNQLLFTGTGRKMRSCECRQDGHFFFLAGVSCDVRWLAAVCFAYVLGTDGPEKV